MAEEEGAEGGATGGARAPLRGPLWGRHGEVGAPDLGSRTFCTSPPRGVASFMRLHRTLLTAACIAYDSHAVSTTNYPHPP